MIGFDEVQFPPDIKAGITGGPGWSTKVVVTSSGAQTRNQNWAEAFRSWDAATGIKNADDFEVVLAFFNACNGMARGFRFKDWNDYQATHVLTNGMQGVMQNTITGLLVGDGSTTIFQLIKAYSNGVTTSLRTIRKPIASGLVAYKNGVTATYALDTTTGLLTFTTAPGSGVMPMWDGQFDVPVTFGVDKLDATIEVLDNNERAISQVTKLPINEYRPI